MYIENKLYTFENKLYIFPSEVTNVGCATKNFKYT